MFDLTDLDLRYRAHYERASEANAADQPDTAEASQPSRLRRQLAAVLLTLASWLEPEPVAPAPEPSNEPAV